MKKKHLLIISGVYTAMSCSNNQNKKTENVLGPDNQKPNIIFIMADDLGYADLGCYGQQKIKTPNIDSLASQGIRFTQCYAGSSVCAPSRSVLMTGMHTGHTTVRGNFGKGGVKGLGGGEGRISLQETDTTIAQVLKKSGYLTAMVGKWGLGEPNTSGEPYKKGFDEFYGFLNQRRAHTYYPDYIWHDTTKIILSGNQDGNKNEYTHELFVDYILDFIERNRDTTFFLYVPFCLPHAHYEIPDLGDYGGENWSENEKIYAAMISRMDKNVGRIVQKLKEVGIDTNTCVFFTSDNGASGQPHDPKIFESNAPLRGSKRDPYDGGIRVPMIVRYPGKISPNQINTQLTWYHADVMPTLAEMAHTGYPDYIDGVSVLPALSGREQNLNDRYLYWEFYEKNGWRALRFGDWKAIQQDMYKEGPRAIELYNIKEDIGEARDVANEYPEVVKRAKKMFEEAHSPSPHFMWDLNYKSANTL